MHELAITQSILDIALEQAGKESAGRIARIHLVIGGMTGVVEECVRFYFGLIAPGTAADGAELVVRTVPVTARCRGCGREYEVRDRVWTCPGCGCSRPDITGGKELIVESIEVTDGSESAQAHPRCQRSDCSPEPEAAG